MSLAHNNHPKVNIQVKKQMPMGEFKALVESKFNLDSAVIMKRTPMMQNQAVEILTDSEDKLGKGLNELRVNEGVILYVENANEKYQLTESQDIGIDQTRLETLTKWEVEFELEVNRCHIKFNLPGLKETVYSESIVVDRRILVEQLKAKIAAQINESIEGIIFRRGGSHGAELVEDDLSFKQANIYNMMSIYLEKGEPTRQGWKRLQFCIAEYYNPDWKSALTKVGEDGYREPHDHEFFTFKELARLPIRTLDSVAKVKETLSQKLSELFPEHEGLKDPSNFRIREKLADKLVQVYHDDRILNTYSMHDDKEIAIQFLPNTNNEDKYLAMIKEWNPQTWELTAPVEIWIDKKATVAQFASSLSTALGIPVENLVCTKINSPWNFHRI